MSSDIKSPVNLLDVTFLILVRLDSINRLENTLATTQFLSQNFDTYIWVSEYSDINNGILKKILVENVRYSFHLDHDPILYRTKFLNQVIYDVDTPFVAVWDTDVIVPVDQVVKSITMLRNGEADFVYPYEKQFLDTSPILRKEFIQDGKIEVLVQNTKKMKELYPPNPVGGAFFANLNVYKESGLENESFYGWGLEDGERFYRWENLGYKVKRVSGPLFHLSHVRGINSVFHNGEQQFFKRKELLNVRREKSVNGFQSPDEKISAQ